MQRKRRCFGCSTREEAPAFSNAEIWRTFPIEDFDVVVIDSWDSFAEGAGEQDSGRSTRALAPLLDLVRRERAPGVVLLGNVTKDGRAGRGSGTVEDRVDNVFEVRDATGFSPSGKQKWWEKCREKCRRPAEASGPSGRPDAPERSGPSASGWRSSPASAATTTTRGRCPRAGLHHGTVERAGRHRRPGRCW